MVKFEPLLAWIAFLGTVFLLAPATIAAHFARLRALVRPLAVLGLVCALATAVNGVVHLRGWDAQRRYGELVAAGGADSNAGIVAMILVPVWPYGAILIGLVMMGVYALIVWRKRSLVAFMTPIRPQPDRITRERARVARFDE